MSHLHNTYSTQLLSMSIALCFWVPSITTAQEPPPPPPPPLGDIFNDIFNDADTDDTTTPKPTTRNSTKNQIYNKPSNTVTTPDNSTAPNIIVPLPTT
ncbi:MAG: hypothetical protein LR017_04240, partial [Candidatus Pacebacteria bacterium]|nr:hypothetical protein [Candidatus Paceibacterota bacterium]